MSTVISELKITIGDDGEVKFDASKMDGSEADILAELGDLIEMLGGDPGDLVVEKHIHRHGKGHVRAHEHIHVGR